MKLFLKLLIVFLIFSFPSCSKKKEIVIEVKEFDQEYLSSISEKSNYQFGDLIGWSGLERNYESVLSHRLLMPLPQ